MSPKHYVRRALSMPPQVLIHRLFILLRHKTLNVVCRVRDACLSTYSSKAETPFIKTPIFSYFPTIPMALLKESERQISGLATLYLSHRFDLLGSGWVQVRHGMPCRGLEGHRFDVRIPGPVGRAGKEPARRVNKANRCQAERIWQLIDHKGSGMEPSGTHSVYTPIDWHLDFKSGFRWAESTWYLQAGTRPRLGADVKVPWELARMQHLPHLAWAFILAKAKDQDAPQSTEESSACGALAYAELYAREFRNQVLDFVASNPPRYGVNWHCTMEVGIRVVNWLVAYDLFRVHRAVFDHEFIEAFMTSVYDHGRHILNNLEWYEGLRSNHYLSNVVGLLFVAAYLPRTSEIDYWLAFAVQELVKEVKLQFNPDGANFEASTSYHRLSAELVVYGTALVLGLPSDKRAALVSFDHRLHQVHPPLKTSPLTFFPLAGSQTQTPFPGWYIIRLQKMAEFILHASKPHGHMPQIGDNDSGRLIKLQCLYQPMTVGEAKARYRNLIDYADLPQNAIHWDEDILDHRHLVAAVSGLFQTDELIEFTGEHWIERFIIRHLAKGILLPSYRQNGEKANAERVRVVKTTWSSAENCFASLISEEPSPQDLSIASTNLPPGQTAFHYPLKFPAPGKDLREGLKLYAYPDFGYYLFRSHRLYLGIRCGSVGQNGNGGHAHNDQLSIELSLDGKNIIQDPGTYIYTPLPDWRNAFRSTAFHFTPQVAGREMNDWPAKKERLFQLPERSKAECLYFNSDGFVGRHVGFGHPVYRLILLHGHEIEIRDHGAENSPAVPPWYSNGYGKLLRS